MTYPNLNNDPEQIITGNDSIVIVNDLGGIRGGRTLDMTGFTPSVIGAGHVIIQSNTTFDYKPMPLNGTATAYAALPADHKYVGILRASILTKKPFAGIMTRGEVNHGATPFDIATILAAVKTALPLIEFRKNKR